MEQPLAFPLFALHPPLLTFSPPYHPLSMHPTLSICQAASALKQCANHCTRSVTRASSPPLVWWDWMLTPCSRLSRQQPDSRTTVRLPGAKSSNDRPLPLKQSHGHTGRERPAKTRSLVGTEEENIFFQIVWRAIYLSVIHDNHPI